jgi:hypothetical protein
MLGVMPLLPPPPPNFDLRGWIVAMVITLAFVILVGWAQLRS